MGANPSDFDASWIPAFKVTAVAGMTGQGDDKRRHGCNSVRVRLGYLNLSFNINHLTRINGKRILCSGVQGRAGNGEEWDSHRASCLIVHPSILKIIQQQLGHSPLATTERYFELAPLEIGSAVGRENKKSCLWEQALQRWPCLSSAVLVE